MTGADRIKDIPMYNKFEQIVLINKGMSGDKKYHIKTIDGEQLLLRIADASEYNQKQAEFEHMKSLVQLGVPMSKPIDFGFCNHGKSVYTLLSWIDGSEVEAILPTLSEQQQYQLGIQSGEILRTIHKMPAPDAINNWSSRYFSVMEERLDAFRSEGVPFPGDQLILDYLETNKHLLQNRPQCHLHGDYHMGNLIQSKDKKLFVIDWHTVDFDGYGDPWYEFNRLGTQYPLFASGQINGYFDYAPPEEFWMLLAYYLAAGAITSIVWAKYFAPKSLDSILNLNRDILRWFDDMKTYVPSWYVNDLENN